MMKYSMCKKKHVRREGWRASGYLVDLSETAPQIMGRLRDFVLYISIFDDECPQNPTTGNFANISLYVDFQAIKSSGIDPHAIFTSYI